jgi:hypothetical protein
MYHGNKTNHRTKDCPIYIDTKQKMDQESTQPSSQLQSRDVNHTMQWAPHNQQHSPSYPPHYPTQPYQNSQTQPPAYCQSYRYATTNNPHPLPIPQITYHPVVSQITYPTPTNTNANQVKIEANPPPPPPHHKPKNLYTNPKTFPPMVPYSQSPEVQTQTSKPKHNLKTIIAKSTTSLMKVPLPKLNGLTCQ